MIEVFAREIEALVAPSTRKGIAVPMGNSHPSNLVQIAQYRFKRGQVANPTGQSGPRRRLTGNFIRALERAWAEEGDAVIKRAIAEDAINFLRIMVAICAPVADTIVDEETPAGNAREELIRRFLAAGIPSELVPMALKALREARQALEEEPPIIEGAE